MNRLMLKTRAAQAISEVVSQEPQGTLYLAEAPPLFCNAHEAGNRQVRAVTSQEDKSSYGFAQLLLHRKSSRG